MKMQVFLGYEDKVRLPKIFTSHAFVNLKLVEKVRLGISRTAK
jgi:hypothetical protein